MYCETLKNKKKPSLWPSIAFYSPLFYPMTKYCKNYKPTNCNRSSFKLNYSKIWYIGFGVVFLSVVFAYLLQINHIAAKGFEIKKLEQKIDIVKEENERLALRMVDLKSAGNIQEKINKLNMVRIDKISYLNTTGAVVAINK